jgi:hypothetical protein
LCWGGHPIHAGTVVMGCIGMAFALFEMKLVLSEVVARFDLALDSRSPLPMQSERRGFTPGISLLWLRVRTAEAGAIGPIPIGHQPQPVP